MDTPVIENDRVAALQVAAGGETNFAYDFLLYEADHLAVIRVRDNVTSLLTHEVDYTVAGLEDVNGGTITLTAPAVAGDVYKLFGAIPIERLADYQQRGQFRSEVVNREMDLVFMTQQELNTRGLQAVRVPPGEEPISPLPDAAARAGGFLGFNGAGDLIVVTNILPGTVTVSPFGEAFVNLANAAAARTNLGAGASGEALFTAADLNGVFAVLGATSLGVDLLTAVSEAAARNDLGASATGEALFTAASAAAARTALGASTIGSTIFTAADQAAVLAALGIENAYMEARWEDSINSGPLLEPDVTWTPLHQVGGSFSPSTGAWTITAAGVYRVDWQAVMSMPSLTANEMRLKLMIDRNDTNGFVPTGDEAIGGMLAGSSSALTYRSTITGKAFITIAAGDKLRLEAQRTSSASLIDAKAASKFMIERIA